MFLKDNNPQTPENSPQKFSHDLWPLHWCAAQPAVDLWVRAERPLSAGTDVAVNHTSDSSAERLAHTTTPPYRSLPHCTNTKTTSTITYTQNTPHTDTYKTSIRPVRNWNQEDIVLNSDPHPDWCRHMGCSVLEWCWRLKKNYNNYCSAN